MGRRLRSRQRGRRVRVSAKLTEGLFESASLRSLRHGKPCHLPLHKGGLVLVPLERVYVINAWLIGQSKTHLCVASSIRAMPETEIPPVFTGGIFIVDQYARL